MIDFIQALPKTETHLHLEGALPYELLVAWDPGRWPPDPDFRARSYRYATSFLYLGRGFNFPVALEGALKLKEISYIHAEGYAAAEMKHGPIALIDKHMPVVLIAPTSDRVYDKIKSNLEEVLARGGSVVAITEDGNAELDGRCDAVLYVPRTEEWLAPLLNVVPLQLLAYYIADLRKCDVDRPRNLAKSVTVE